MGSYTDPTPRGPVAQWAGPEILGNVFTCAQETAVRTAETTT